MLENGYYVLTTNDENGERSVYLGPEVVWLGPRETIMSQPGMCPVLSGEEFMIVSDELKGTKKTITGPIMFQPEAYDQLAPIQKAINLAKNQYVKIKNAEGLIRVERGQAKVILQPLEEVLGPDGEPIRGEPSQGVCDASNIDVHNAVLVRDTSSGTLQLYTIESPRFYDQVQGMAGDLAAIFVPDSYEEIVNNIKKTVLEEYHEAVVKDKNGQFIFKSGKNADERSFFLEPFNEFVTQEWSTDLKKEHKRGQLDSKWLFDLRPAYMNYEFNCRTVDNVELIVDVSFYWQITNTQKMIRKMTDTPCDICTHARSKIIQSVSRITLMEFLKKFNQIIRDGAGVADNKQQTIEAINRKERAARGEEDEDEGNNMTSALGDGEDGEEDQDDQWAKEHATKYVDTWYVERGVELLSVEVLQFSCSNPETDKTLQAIIKETADRLKKQEFQKGENEMALSKLKGEIEQEKLNKDLIELKKSHLKTEAKIEGEGVAAFIEGVSGREHMDRLHRRKPLLEREIDQLEASQASLAEDDLEYIQGAAKLEDLKLEQQLLVDLDIKNADERYNQEHVQKEEALHIYAMLRKLDSVRMLSASGAGMYITPNDVNLTVGQLYPAVRDAAKNPAPAIPSGAGGSSMANDTWHD